MASRLSGDGVVRSSVTRLTTGRGVPRLDEDCAMKSHGSCQGGSQQGELREAPRTPLWAAMERLDGEAIWSLAVVSRRGIIGGDVLQRLKAEAREA